MDVILRLTHIHLLGLQPLVTLFTSNTLLQINPKVAIMAVAVKPGIGHFDKRIVKVRPQK